jgi:hypothetical protein
MADWTRDQVEQRLEEAADVLKRLPDRSVQGYFSLWPQIKYEFADLVGQEPPRLKRPPPPADAISRMEETLTWTVWLEPDDGKLVWARAEGTPWKPLCWRFGLSRATAHRRYDYALSLIAWRLNGRAPPTKRSRAFVVERARERSGACR